MSSNFFGRKSDGSLVNNISAAGDKPSGTQEVVSKKLSEGANNEQIFAYLKKAKELFDFKLQQSNSEDEREAISVELYFINAALENGDVSLYSDKNDFILWAVGRGPQEYHDKTPWNRTPRWDVPSVRSYIEGNMEKRWRLIKKVSMLEFQGKLGTLKTLQDFHDYYRFVIKGDEITDFSELREYTNWETYKELGEKASGEFKDEINNKLEGWSVGSGVVAPPNFKKVESDFVQMIKRDFDKTTTPDEKKVQEYKTMISKLTPYVHLLEQETLGVIQEYKLGSEGNLDNLEAVLARISKLNEARSNLLKTIAILESQMRKRGSNFKNHTGYIKFQTQLGEIEKELQELERAKSRFESLLTDQEQIDSEIFDIIPKRERDLAQQDQEAYVAEVHQIISAYATALSKRLEAVTIYRDRCEDQGDRVLMVDISNLVIRQFTEILDEQNENANRLIGLAEEEITLENLPL